MNRSLGAVLLGTTLDYARHHADAREAEGEPDLTLAEPAGPTDDPFPRATEVIRMASKVIIIPGYGMALAHAQTCTVQLTNRLREMGKDVKFAVHPLSGRMPGHMHVLLAEAEVDPDMLFDLNEVNPEFPATDLALVVGACDVVNPAAVSVDGTPISGMPILAAHEACFAWVRPDDGLDALLPEPDRANSAGGAVSQIHGDELGAFLPDRGRSPGAGVISSEFRGIPGRSGGDADPFSGTERAPGVGRRVGRTPICRTSPRPLSFPEHRQRH